MVKNVRTWESDICKKIVFREKEISAGAFECPNLEFLKFRGLQFYNFTTPNLHSASDELVR